MFTILINSIIKSHQHVEIFFVWDLPSGRTLSYSEQNQIRLFEKSQCHQNEHMAVEKSLTQAIEVIISNVFSYNFLLSSLHVISNCSIIESISTIFIILIIINSTTIECVNTIIKSDLCLDNVNEWWLKCIVNNR